MNKGSKIYLAGHAGLVGSAIHRKLVAEGYSRIITRSRSELDLLDQKAVNDFFDNEKPEYVILAAAKVGGIYANNTYPADFIAQNLVIQSNVIMSAQASGVQRLLFLGSSCIYPKMCPQPMKEEHLLTGPLEPTNESYAIAKIAGIKMCSAFNRQFGTRFASVMPTNLYGPNDNFHLENAHVLPAMIRKFHEAKQAGAASVELWGTGTPRREFLHVDDMADACVFVLGMDGFTDMVNIGWGEDVTIRELAEIIGEVVGFEGELRFDTTKPDGTPRKLLDVSRLKALGWKAKIPLRDGIKSTYEWYLDNRDRYRER